MSESHKRLYIHLGAYFIVVTLANILLTTIVVFGFALPPESILGTFIGLYFVCMLVIGLIWLAAVFGVNLEGIEVVGVVIGVILGIVIGVPLLLISLFATAFKSIGDYISTRVNEAINNAFTQFFENVLEDVEVPGFELLLLITLFIIISMIIIYSYHRKVTKSSSSIISFTQFPNMISFRIL
ncbi:MAG: hypothetical protein ACFFBP_15455 [Promethearchaeota archaeon]